MLEIGNTRTNKGSELDEMLQYGPSRDCLRLLGRVMRSSVGPPWPWRLAVGWLVSAQLSQCPETLSAFLTSACFFLYSCLFSQLSLCQIGVRVPTAERSGSQARNMLTCWKHEITSRNNSLKDRDSSSHQLR